MLFAWAQDEEEGALMTVTNIEELKDFANTDGSYTFLTPAGKLITLPPTISEVYFSTGDNWEEKEGCTGFSLAPIGTLTHFVIKVGETETKYKAKKSCSSDNFNGYKDDSDNPYKDEISYNLKPSKYIIGIPCLHNNAVAFKAIQETESTTPTFEQANYGTGTLQPFDYIVSKINWQNTAKYINAKMVPALGEEALDFIYSRENSAKDNNLLYPYIFTHAHQINQYPEVYRMCWMGQFTNNEEFDEFFINSRIPKDFYGNNTGNLLQTALAYWKDKGYSTYYEYNQVLKQFKNLGTQDGATILELLEETKDYSCLWKTIKAEGRLNTIKKLVFEVKVDGEEEKLLIGLFNTVPDQAQAQTLYNGLQSDNTGLLAELDKSIDGVNHVKYYTALSNLLVLAKGNTELKNQINALESLTADGQNKSIVEWSDDGIFFWLNPTFVQSLLNGNHKLLYRNFEIKEDGTVYFTIQEVVPNPLVNLPENPITLKPLDLVRVDFKTSSEALNTNEGNTVYIPAVSLSILANEQWKQEMNDAINVGLLIGGSGIFATTGRTALIVKGAQQAISSEVRLILSYLRITPKSFATLFLTDIGLQATTNYLIDKNWANALGQIDLFDAAFTGTVGNIASIPIKGSQLLHLAKYGKQFSLCRQITTNTTKVVTIEFTKVAFNYEIADNQLKTLCNNNESYYDVMSKLVLALAAKYTAEEIHGFLKGWNSKVVESIEVEFDQIAKPILLEFNEIVQTENFKKIIEVGTKVIADFIIHLKSENVNVEYKIDDIETLNQSVTEIDQIKQDNTQVVLPLIE